MPTGFVLGLLVIAAALVVVMVIRPERALPRGGKIMAFISVLVLPAFCGVLGFENHMENAKSTSFCLTCHIMGSHGRSLYVDDNNNLAAAHFQNSRVPRDQACFTCHTDYTMYGNIHAKIRGLHHIYAQYFEHPNESTLKLYNPYNNRECLHCHEGARSFEEGVVHTADPQVMADIKSNKLSCISSGCHDNVHDTKDLNKAKFWKPPVAANMEKTQ